MSEYVRRFDEIGLSDAASVGGRNASSGETSCAPAPRGVRVPEGFAVTTAGYRRSVASSELDERVRSALARVASAQAIRTAKRHGRKIGLCGQAPSDHPAFAEFLVAEGIDSTSLDPDALFTTLPRIAAAEAGTSLAPVRSESSVLLPATAPVPGTAAVRSSS